MLPNSSALIGLVGYYEGYDSEPTHLCLDAEMIISEKEEKPVSLINVTYNEKALDSEISLSYFEAFMIFSNIIVQHNLDTFLKFTSLPDKNIISKLYDSLEALKSRFLYPLHRFTVSYIEFLSKKIMDNSMSPFSILRFGGIASLIILLGLLPVKKFIQEMIEKLLNDTDNLSKTEKILFFSYLYCLWFYKGLRRYEDSFLPKLNTLFTNKEKLKEILDDMIPKHIKLLTNYLIE